MDFWNVYEKAKMRPSFSASRMLLSARDERTHTSISTVSGQSLPVGKGECIFRKCTESERYVLAQDIGKDIMLSIYDVNSSCAILLRFQAALTDRSLAMLGSDIRRLRSPDFKVRLIGLQNKAAAPLKSVEKIERLVKPSNLQEVDLFGREVRHIAFDLKSGVTYNLLLLDRIYEPSEMVDSSADEVNAVASELKFV